MPGVLVSDGFIPVPIKIDVKRLWNNIDLVTVLNQDLKVRVYAVVGTAAALIGSSDGLGKCDSGSAVANDNGTVELYVSQADNVAGSSGNTSRVYKYTFPNAIPPKPPTNSSNVDTALREKVNRIQDYLNDASNVMEEI